MVQANARHGENSLKKELALDVGDRYVRDRSPPWPDEPRHSCVDELTPRHLAALVYRRPHVLRSLYSLPTTNDGHHSQSRAHLVPGIDYYDVGRSDDRKHIAFHPLYNLHVFDFLLT